LLLLTLVRTAGCLLRDVDVGCVLFWLRVRPCLR
jgi:hypothetical protein